MREIFHKQFASIFFKFDSMFLLMENIYQTGGRGGGGEVCDSLYVVSGVVSSTNVNITLSWWR